MPTPEDFVEMKDDFDMMVEKLKYYSELAKGYSGDEEEDDEEEMQEGEEGEIEDPKGAAILIALKRKMKE